MFVDKYFLTAIIFYIFSYGYYFFISHGLGNKATFLQMRRFIPCAILAILPAATVNLPLTNPLFLIPAIICWLWIFTYPTLYYISNHKVSSDFEFHFEAVFGLYIIGWITSLGILSSYVSILHLPMAIFITIVELLLFLIPMAQIVYYGLYKSCINENGMQALLETHYNEIIEYFKSMPWYLNMLCFLGTVSTAAVFSYLNISNHIATPTFSYITIGLNIAIAIFLTSYLWKKQHGVFIRTAIVEFYLDIKEYMEKNKLYGQNREARLKDLEVTPLAKPFDKPSTILLVIGESASRDYMHAFNKVYPYPTTPWLDDMSQQKNMLIFPHAYSSFPNTVTALSMSLTEMNQYNDKKFYESCSIVDIAKKLGYKVHWYSNQGHLGCADTPITLVADTADVAKWTKQKLNQVQYDESLLEYLDEVDPSQNNFIVLHLKGSHFNFINRYPEAFTKFGKAGKYDLELNYANSIAYTDHVLEQFYNYAKEKLNLQAMIYFSDHAAIPDKRRSPNFEGLGIVRVPLFTYFSDEYISKNPSVYDTLQKKQQEYWTNDLAYELVCGILNIQSNKFDEANCLASPNYKYKRGDLLTNNGSMHIG